MRYETAKTKKNKTIINNTKGAMFKNDWKGKTLCTALSESKKGITKVKAE